MKTVEISELQTRLLEFLEEIEQTGERFVICQEGKPIADLTPHHCVNRLHPHRKSGDIKINYDPTQTLPPELWRQLVP